MKSIDKWILLTAVTACTVMSNAVEVFAEQPNSIGIVKSTLNIRRGASSKEKVIIKAPVGEEVEVMSSTTEKGWAQIRYKGKTGWGYMNNVKEKKISSPVRYLSGTHRVVLREKPNSKSEVLGYIYEGDKVTVVDYKGSYARVKYNGKIYYMNKKYLNTKNPAKTMYISGVWRKVLKSGYLDTSKTLGYVMEAEPVTVVGYRKGRAHIKYKGKRYYIKNSNLVSKNPVEYKYIDGAEKVAVTYGNDKVVGYVGRGQQIKCFGVKDGYTRISFNGQTGFIKGTNNIKDYSVKTVDGASMVSVYSRMTNGEEIGSVPKGMNLMILAENSNWCKIKYGGTYAYIKKEYLKEVKYVESAKKVVMRKTTSKDGIELYKLNNGEKVEVKGYSNGWCKVSYKGKIGYIENQFLVIGKDGSNESYITGLSADSSNSDLRYIDRDNVRVYKNPLIDETIHGYLIKGSAVEFISHLDGTYTKVKVNNSVIGYVRRDCLNHRNPLAKNSTSKSTKSISKTHSEYVKSQESNPYVKIEDVEYYSNPLNFSISNDDEKYQFLKLDSFRNVNAYDLNVYLNNLSVSPGKEAIFKNQASAFINAAKKYNIDPIYLLAHTLLESGYGSSALAQGIVVSEDAAGNKVKPTKVYNLFGIGAVDWAANEMGSKTAYALGWTSVEKAIDGAAKWIAQGVEANASVGLKKSDGYIHSSRFTHQYTLYSMRWDYISEWHQYCSDALWPLKISRLMNKLSYIYEGVNLEFETPVYAKEKSLKIDTFEVVDEINMDEEVAISGDASNEGDEKDILENSTDEGLEESNDNVDVQMEKELEEIDYNEMVTEDEIETDNE